MRDEFWIVWSPTGMFPPKFRHPSESAAMMEAARLCREKRGDEFFVCKATHRAVSRDVDLVSLSTGEDADVPF